MMNATAHYLLDSADPRAGQRFDLLEQLLDERSMLGLQETYVPLAPRIWEVGCGSGSLAARLAAGDVYSGADVPDVLATDIDLRHVDRTRPGAERVRFQQHNVLRDPLPSERFDIIHARLVIQHLPEPLRVLEALMTCLAPGGFLAIEELTPVLDYCLDRSHPERELVNRVGRAFTRSLELAGASVYLGPRLVPLLAQMGLGMVTGRVDVLQGRGGGPEAQLMRVNVLQCAEDLLQADPTLTSEHLARYVQVLEDPTLRLTLPFLYWASGRKVDR